MDEFEDVLNSFLHIRNADVYVTGSNSKFLSSDVITEFRGRGDEIRIYPHIRNKEELDELINILASATGSLTNPLKLSKKM